MDAQLQKSGLIENNKNTLMIAGIVIFFCLLSASLSLVGGVVYNKYMKKQELSKDQTDLAKSAMKDIKICTNPDTC